MLPFGYNAWDTEALVVRRASNWSAEVDDSHTDGDYEITHVFTAPSEATSDNAVTAVQLTEYNVANYPHTGGFVKASQF